MFYIFEIFLFGYLPDCDTFIFILELCNFLKNSALRRKTDFLCWEGSCYALTDETIVTSKHT